MTLTGDEGKLVIGFQFAAKLQRWSVTRPEMIGARYHVLTALVVDASYYGKSYREFTVGLWTGKVWWVWSGTVESDIVPGEPVTIRLDGDPTARASF